MFLEKLVDFLASDAEDDTMLQGMVFVFSTFLGVGLIGLTLLAILKFSLIDWFELFIVYVFCSEILTIIANRKEIPDNVDFRKEITGRKIFAFLDMLVIFMILISLDSVIAITFNWLVINWMLLISALSIVCIGIVCALSIVCIGIVCIVGGSVLLGKIVSVLIDFNVWIYDKIHANNQENRKRKELKVKK